MVGTVRFTPTVEDHVAAQRLWLASYWRRPRLRALAALCLIVFIVAAALAFYGMLVEYRSLTDVVGELVWPLAAPVVFAGIQLLGWAQIPRSVRRMSRENPALLSATEWRWDDGRVVATSAAGSAIVRWSDLHRWLKGSASVVLLPTERMLLILPLRAIDATDAADLLGTIARFARDARKT